MSPRSIQDVHKKNSVQLAPKKAIENNAKEIENVREEAVWDGRHSSTGVTLKKNLNI